MRFSATDWALRLVVPKVLLCLLASHGFGASLTMTTDGPLRLEAGTTAGSLIVSAVNSTPEPLPSENLAAWQLVLQIIPDAAATGTVEIDSTGLPPNYVLAGINFGLTSSITTQASTNDSVFAFDFNFPFSGGAPVPMAPGAGLLQLHLIASDDARGDFQLVAKPGLGVTEWSGGSEIGTAREFENLIQATDDVAIGLVTVGTVVPVSGDCNGDGVVDAADLACVCGADSGALAAVLGATGLPHGDLDADGTVALADFLRLSANFGQVVDRYTDGDVDCDGQVAFADFLLISANFGQSSTAMIDAVPEPNTLVLLCLASFIHAVRNQRRKAFKQRMLHLFDPGHCALQPGAPAPQGCLRKSGQLSD